MSVADNEIIAGTSPIQATVTEAGAGVSIVGGVVSTTANVAEVVEALPQSSVAVNVTVAEPVLPQSSLNAVKSLDQVIPVEQASEAAAPPLDDNQACKAAALPAPSHCTVALTAAVSIVGAVVSSIANVAEVVAVLPQSSVAVNSTVTLPVLPQPSLNPSKLLDQVTLEQISEATAPPLDDNQACNASVLPFPSH